MSHRWIPSLQQLEEARQKLPSAYHYATHRGPVFRVAVPYPNTCSYTFGVDEFSRPVSHTIDFRLEERRDPGGFGWRRWVYDGPVAV
jgi:hypothetical protein